MSDMPKTEGILGRISEAKKIELIESYNEIETKLQNLYYLKILIFTEMIRRA